MFELILSTKSHCKNCNLLIPLLNSLFFNFKNQITRFKFHIVEDH